MTETEKQTAKVRAAWDEVTQLPEWQEATTKLKLAWLKFDTATVERSRIMDDEYRKRGLGDMMRERGVLETIASSAVQAAVYGYLDAYDNPLPVAVFVTSPDGVPRFATNLHGPVEAEVVFCYQFRHGWLNGRAEYIFRHGNRIQKAWWRWRMRFEIWRIKRKIHKEKKTDEQREEHP